VTMFVYCTAHGRYDVVTTLFLLNMSHYLEKKDKK
jgi:hypothetical protein